MIPTYNQVANAALIAAKSYKSVVDHTVGMTTYTAKATYSCANAIMKTVQSAANLGVKGSALELGKWVIGVNNIKDGIEALKVNDAVFVDQDGRTMKLEDTRDFAARVGEMGGHFTMALGKVSGAGLFGISSYAYARGTVANFLYDYTKFYTQTSAPSFLTFESTSRVFANGVNTLGKYGFNAALSTTKFVSSNLIFGITKVAGNPVTAIRFGVAGAGMGAALYLASSEFIKASEAQGFVGKIAHGTAALAGLGMMVIVPIIVYPTGA